MEIYQAIKVISEDQNLKIFMEKLMVILLVELNKNVITFNQIKNVMVQEILQEDKNLIIPPYYNLNTKNQNP